MSGSGPNVQEDKAMTDAPLPPLPEPFMEFLTPTVQFAWEDQMHTYARAAIAAAQSHFDRTIAERDTEIAALKSELRDIVKQCGEHGKTSSPVYAVAYALMEQRDRAAEAEKDAWRMRIQLSEVNEVLTDQGWHVDRGLLQRVRQTLDALRTEGSGNG
jgi:hypothetical protein